MFDNVQFVLTLLLLIDYYYYYYSKLARNILNFSSNLEPIEIFFYIRKFRNFFSQ